MFCRLECSRLALLTAIYCLLDIRRQPSRLARLGMWLALLWWLRERAMSARNLNLTAIWYLAAALKAVWLLLLTATKHDFYGSSRPDAGAASPSASQRIARVHTGGAAEGPRGLGVSTRRPYRTRYGLW